MDIKGKPIKETTWRYLINIVMLGKLLLCKDENTLGNALLGK